MIRWTKRLFNLQYCYMSRLFYQPNSTPMDRIRPCSVASDLARPGGRLLLHGTAPPGLRRRHPAPASLRRHTPGRLSPCSSGQSSPAAPRLVVCRLSLAPATLVVRPWHQCRRFLRCRRLARAQPPVAVNLFFFSEICE
jgi:hypothetical protein